MKKIWLMSLGACILVICIFAAACVSPEVPVNTDNPVLTVIVEKTGIMIPVNAAMTFILPANPTTGYTWNVMESSGLNVTDEYKATPVPEGWTGGGGYQYYTLTAEKAGTYTFKAAYARSWETDTEPIYTMKQILVFSEAENNDNAGDVMLSVLFDGTVNPKAGDVVKICTEGNPTTGYYWTAVTQDGLTIVKDDYITDITTGLVGAGGTYVWYVTAEKAGTYEFKATYQRSGQDPANVFFFDLTFV
ncbi:protease inhibitor I42 family protein [uncultured Methanocorpusculum sp.]|nr:protease inhibitor I42 family protein [uncultured Methanocorpusculum sp.]